MLAKKIGLPYEKFNLADEFVEFINELDNTTTYSAKIDEAEPERLYGLTLVFNAHKYDMEDAADLLVFMEDVPEDKRVLAFPIGEVYHSLIENYNGESVISTIARPGSVKYYALLLIGEDGSVWLNDKMSIRKAAENIIDYLLRNPETHYKFQYDLVYKF